MTVKFKYMVMSIGQTLHRCIQMANEKCPFLGAIIINHLVPKHSTKTNVK